MPWPVCGVAIAIDLSNKYLSMNYKGLFVPTHPEKYKGDLTKIIYRSYWELSVMRFFDKQEKVVSWSSETIYIPYRCPLDREKIRKYCPDFCATLANGTKMIIEVKPHIQTLPPKQGKRKKKYLKEAAVFLKNQAKWQSAQSWANKHNYFFYVWTEKTLESMGIYKRPKKQ